MGIQHFVDQTQLLDNQIFPPTEDDVKNACLFVVEQAIKNDFVDELPTIMSMLGMKE